MSIVVYRLYDIISSPDLTIKKCAKFTRCIQDKFYIIIQLRVGLRPSNDECYYD